MKERNFPGRSINIQILSLYLEKQQGISTFCLKKPVCFSWARIQVNVSKWVRSIQVKTCDESLESDDPQGFYPENWTGTMQEAE